MSKDEKAFTGFFIHTELMWHEDLSKAFINKLRELADENPQFKIKRISPNILNYTFWEVDRLVTREGFGEKQSVTVRVFDQTNLDHIHSRDMLRLIQISPKGEHREDEDMDRVYEICRRLMRAFDRLGYIILAPFKEKE